MRWDPQHESPDVIDRRGAGGAGLGGGGGGLGGLLWLLPLLLRSRFGWLILLLLVGAAVVGGIRGLGGSQTQKAADTQVAAQSESREVHFVSFVLDDTQATWRQIFEANGRTYRNAKLVLFTDATRTACGTGQAAAGPFYCPADERVYVDLGFYDELAQRFGAKGDFAEAYVVAHEIGHHVQKQLGISQRVAALGQRQQIGQEGASVRLELQADCFAGIWARSTDRRNLLDQGDVAEALGAAAAVGDDRLQREATGTVHPEKWTHGSAEERSRWFDRGFEGGSIEDCDTFGAAGL
jgi:predicted metalloprotease